MLPLLQRLGLNEKEARVYLLLIDNPHLTAAEIARLSEESRTNTYMILDRLVDIGVVAVGGEAVKRFDAMEPTGLQRIIYDKQAELKAAHAELRSALPALNSKFRLSHHKPGVIYREGLEGLRESFDDMYRVGEEVLVFISDTSPDNSEALNVIVSSLEKRKQRGIQSRGLLHEEGRNYATINEYVPKRNMSVRFLGDLPYEGEVAIYGDKCAFTVYLPTIIVTTITNAVLANTMRTVFENLWQQAKP